MRRADVLTFGLVALLHLAGLAALSLMWRVRVPSPPNPSSIEVTLAPDVGETSTAKTPAAAPPAPSLSPEPEPAAPDDTTPPEPVKPVTAKPKTPPVAKAVAEVTPPAQVAHKAAKRPPSTLLSDLALNSVTARKAAAAPAPAPAKPRRSLLGDLLKDGSGAQPGTAKTKGSTAPQGPRDLSGLQAAFLAQVQPCAQAIHITGTGVTDIVLRFRIRLHEDGSFSAPPEVTRRVTTDENARYAPILEERARNAFVSCQNYHLPADLYKIWRDFPLNYRLSK